MCSSAGVLITAQDSTYAALTSPVLVNKTHVKKLLFPPNQLFAEIKTSKSPCHGAHFFGTILKQGSELKSCLSTKRSCSWDGGGWSFAFLRKLRQCCSFRGNYANSCAYKLAFVHENCLEFVASRVFPSGAEGFLFLFLASFSASLKERIASDEVFHF